jgi:ParB-like chromosome segregation protein Spo0J
VELIEIPIADIDAKGRRRKAHGDIHRLMESIERRGLIQPVVVNGDRKLLAGGRRLTACIALGWDTIPAVVRDDDYEDDGGGELDWLEVENDENEVRKDFTLSEKADIAAAIAKAIKDGKVAVPKGTPRREYIAQTAGFDSDAEMRRMQDVIADGAPELVAAVDQGDVTLGAAADLIELPKAEQAKVVKEGPKAAKAKAKEVRDAKPKGGGRGKGPAEPVKQGTVSTNGDSEQVDGLGNPVPDCVADAFFDPALRNLVVEVFDHGKALKTLVDRIKSVARKSAAWPFAGFGKAMTAVANAIDDIKEAHGHLDAGVPFAVCPKCRGNGCAACSQSGHLTRHMHDNADQYGG